MTVVDGILAAIELLMKLYLAQGGGLDALKDLPSKCDAEIKRIDAQEAADEKAARDARP